MFKNSLKTFMRPLVLALPLLALAQAASATMLHVQLDTHAFGNTTGYIDMQFSASGKVPLATALVTNLSGFHPDTFIDSWGVTTTTNGYLFRNDTINDLYQAASFGGLLSFDLSVDGAADPKASYITHFVVSAYDDSGVPIGNYDPVSGALVNFSWTPPVSNNGSGTLSAAIADPSVVAVIPEPADLVLVGTGLVSMLAAIRRRRPSKPQVATSPA
jgi:hypothetical protein